MKKLFVLLAALGLSFTAHATGGGMAPGAAVVITHAEHTNQADADFTCQALNRREMVTVNASNNVEGYIDCPAATTINVATCHLAGRIHTDDEINVFIASSRGGRVVSTLDLDELTFEECTAANAQTAAEGDIDTGDAEPEQ